MGRTKRTVDQEAEVRAKAARLSASDLRPHVIDQLNARPLEITYESFSGRQIAEIVIVEGPELDHPSVRLVFNLNNAFVQNCMWGDEIVDEDGEGTFEWTTTDAQRAAMEIMFVAMLGVSRDLDGTMTPEDHRRYQQIIHDISDRLHHGAEILHEMWEAP